MTAIEDLKQRAQDWCEQYSFGPDITEAQRVAFGIIYDLANTPTSTLPNDWKPFDHKDRNTWPKSEGFFLIAKRGNVVTLENWDGLCGFWPHGAPFDYASMVYAYMRLPDPPPEPERKP